MLYCVDLVMLKTFWILKDELMNSFSLFHVPINAIFVEGTKSSSKMRKILPRGEISKKILKNINATQVMYVISFTMPFKNPENS